MIPRSLYQAAVLSNLARRSPYPPPRIAVVLAKIAGWSAIGAMLAVLALPVLALLDHLI